MSLKIVFKNIVELLIWGMVCLEIIIIIVVFLFVK